MPNTHMESMQPVSVLRESAADLSSGIVFTAGTVLAAREAKRAIKGGRIVEGISWGMATAISALTAGRFGARAADSIDANMQHNRDYEQFYGPQR